jgi:adenylate cyclase
MVLGKKYRSYQAWFQIGNFVIMLLWWNIFIRLFVWLQFSARESLNLSKAAEEVVITLHESISTSVLIVSSFVVLLWLVDRFIIDRLRPGFSLMLVVVLQLVAFTFIFSLTAFFFGVYYCSVLQGIEAGNMLGCVDSFVVNHTMLLFFVATLVIKFSLEFIFEIQRRLGFGMFWKYALGHYRKPKEENRIFLFLDLVSSTETSVQLGHVKYSEFLQDFFKILDNSLIKTRATVYQYIGDEAVITWDATRNKNFLKAVEFIYSFNIDIERKRMYFQNKYGLVPDFTASLNSGKIMTAQVGVTKTNCISWQCVKYSCTASKTM